MVNIIACYYCHCEHVSVMVSASLFKYSLREMLVWHILRDVPSSTFFFLLVSRGQDPGPSWEWSFHMILYTYQGWKYLLHKYGQKSKKWNKKCKSKQIMLFSRLFVMNKPLLFWSCIFTLGLPGLCIVLTLPSAKPLRLGNEEATGTTAGEAVRM